MLTLLPFLQYANRTFKRSRNLSSSFSLMAREPLKLSSCSLWLIHCTTRSCMITMIAWFSYCSPCHIMPANMLKRITNLVQKQEEQMGSLGCLWALGPFWPLCEDTKICCPCTHCSAFVCSTFCFHFVFVSFSVLAVRTQSWKAWSIVIVMILTLFVKAKQNKAKQCHANHCISRIIVVLQSLLWVYANQRKLALNLHTIEFQFLTLNHMESVWHWITCSPKSSSSSAASFAMFALDEVRVQHFHMLV